jgi:hypothetical protein
MASRLQPLRLEEVAEEKIVFLLAAAVPTANN